MRLLWGDLVDTEGMQDTPLRVAKHWIDATQGLQQEAIAPLKKTFECDHDEIVLIKNIPFNSLCEHHLLPFFGVAHVGYIPAGRVVGLSKIPRSLDILASRPQLQERLTTQVAVVIEEAIAPVGVIVVIKANHACMSTRGVLKGDAITITSCVRGVFKTDAQARHEVLSLINAHE